MHPLKILLSIANPGIDKSVEQIIALGYDKDIVEKIARLIDRSEYKRRQAPPGVKITPRAFGRDRRLPLVNLFQEWQQRKD